MLMITYSVSLLSELYKKCAFLNHNCQAHPFYEITFERIQFLTKKKLCKTYAIAASLQDYRIRKFKRLNQGSIM